MINSRSARVVLALLLASLPALASAAPACPTVVTDAARKAFPDAKVTRCVAEGAIFEVVMQHKDRSIIELDISATGQIEQIEEVVASVPEAVTRAFAARYPRATMLKAEKQTKADHSITFELAFKAGKTLREATFRADGTFVEEE